MEGTCALCLEWRELRKSHLVPAWVFDRARQFPSPDAPVGTRHLDQHFLRIGPYGMKPTSAQQREHLLCSACEARFQAWETPVSVLVRQCDGSFPARDRCAAVPLLPGLFRIPGLDSNEILRFGISVLWRASVSKKRYFAEVTFGEKYDELFREYLLRADSKFPTGAVLKIYLIDPKRLGQEDATGIDAYLDCLAGSPGMHRLDGQCRIYTFLVFGMHFRLLLGEVHPEIGASCFSRTQLVEISDGSEFRDAIVRLGVTGLKRQIAGRMAR